MEMEQMVDLYKNMAERTDGDVYIGVVGPVRSGKSTLITRFMEQLVLPRLAEGPKKDRISDELPQSGSGRTIMTTQPHFVPNEAVTVELPEQTVVRIRLVDSVGYLIPGALGTAEHEAARMVQTPWSVQPMPFEQAAETGTRKVMTDHATIGLVVTTDGTITELPRSAYAQAEARVVAELKQLGKPFVVVLNSAAPRSPEALTLRDQLEEGYGVPVMLVNVKEMNLADIRRVLESVLMEFPLREVVVDAPVWLSALDENHWLVQEVLADLHKADRSLYSMRETDLLTEAFADSSSFETPKLAELQPGRGMMRLMLPVKSSLFTRILGEECGTEIQSEAHLLKLMKDLVSAKHQFDRVAEAMGQVDRSGYGMVVPSIDVMTLEEPQLVKQSGQYGIRLKAHAPALHLIRVEMESEVAPTIGTQKQAEELLNSLQDSWKQAPAQLWDTNFFGKTLSDMVQEEMQAKMSHMPAETRQKVQEALSRMMNEGEGGMLCILL